MSQPCSAPQLVLFDADLFSTTDTAGALAALVAARDIRRGAVSDRPDIAARLDDEGAAQWFDFWLAGDDGVWPFARALALVSVEPQRALLVSDAAAAVRAAEDAGLRACPADLEELERQLG
jgi:beta-phosphoglucomutase-like phosphatase (HAD superfamily)